MDCEGACCFGLKKANVLLTGFVTYSIDFSQTLKCPQELKNGGETESSKLNGLFCMNLRGNAKSDADNGSLT